MKKAQKEVLFVAKKEEKRTDMIAEAEEATGIPYQTIIHSICRDMGFSLGEADEVVYAYEAGRKIPRRVTEFAAFLLREWKKEIAQKP